MATQTIAKAFDSPFVCYDIAQFGAHTWWAGEYCPGNVNYAAGAGPGLFQRLRGATGVPTPVAGSETYRFYALTVFDGKLVAFGCLTADVLALPIPSYLRDDGAPIRWWHNPPPDLYVFTSSNGTTWSSYNCGQLQSELGDFYGYSNFHFPGSIENVIIRATLRWVHTQTDSGIPCVRLGVGEHVLTWTGVNPVQVSTVVGRIWGIGATPWATYLFSCKLSGDPVGFERWWAEYAEGQLWIHDAGGAASQSLYLMIPTAAQSASVLWGSIPILPHRADFTGGILRAMGYGYGTMVLVFSPDEVAGVEVDSRIGAFLLPCLPMRTVTIDASKIDYLTWSEHTRWYARHNKVDPMLVRFAEGKAYIHQRTDCRDVGYFGTGVTQPDTGLDTVPVFEVPLVDVDGTETKPALGEVAVHAYRIKWVDGTGDGPTGDGPTVDAARVDWSNGTGDGQTGGGPTVDAARADWSDGTGSGPTVEAAGVTWHGGLTTDVGAGDSLIVFSHTFDTPVSHVRVSFHSMPVIADVEVLQCGVRVDSTADGDDLGSYDLVTPFHNYRLREPGTVVDVAFVVPFGDVVGPATLVGHKEK